MEKSMIKTNHIAKCATNLFIEYGIKKVTVEEICKQAGISKGTYYKYFSNKLDLVIHIVNDIFEESSKGFFKLIEEGVSFEALLKHIIVAKMKFMEKYGTRFLKDLYEGTMPELNEVILRMQKESHEQALTMYNNAISQGDIDEQVTFEFFMYLLGTVQEMFLDQKVIAIYHDPIKRMNIVFNNFFYGILKSNHPH